MVYRGAFAPHTLIKFIRGNKMKNFIKISLQFFADDPTPDPNPTPPSDLDALKEAYEKAMSEIRQDLEASQRDLEIARTELKLANERLDRIIDNRDGTTSADAVTANIKKLLK